MGGVIFLAIIFVVGVIGFIITTSRSNETREQKYYRTRNKKVEAEEKEYYKTNYTEEYLKALIRFFIDKTEGKTALDSLDISEFIGRDFSPLYLINYSHHVPLNSIRANKIFSVGISSARKDAHNIDTQLGWVELYWSITQEDIDFFKNYKASEPQKIAKLEKELVADYHDPTGEKAEKAKLEKQKAIEQAEQEKQRAIAEQERQQEEKEQQLFIEFLKSNDKCKLAIGNFIKQNSKLIEDIIHKVFVFENKFDNDFIDDELSNINNFALLTRALMENFGSYVCDSEKIVRKAIITMLFNEWIVNFKAEYNGFCEDISIAKELHQSIRMFANVFDKDNTTQKIKFSFFLLLCNSKG